MSPTYSHIRHSALQLIRDGRVYWTQGCRPGAPMMHIDRADSPGLHNAIAAFMRAGDAEDYGPSREHGASGKWGPAPKLRLTPSGRNLLGQWDHEHGPAS